MSTAFTPTEQILSDLVGFDTTSAKSNLALIDYVKNYLAQFGVESVVLPNPEGTKANLYAVIGPKVDGGLILSGHSDVVPTTGEIWESDPYQLTLREGRLYGRGSTDMKGFIASVLAAVPALLAMPLARPVHLAVSFDEELGCSGVSPMIEVMANDTPQPQYCLVGEPTLLEPVTAHKGGRAYRCHFKGLPVHSSLAPQGANAIEAAADLVVFLRGVASDMAQGYHDPEYDLTHTTLSTGMIQGGNAINIVPAEAVVTFEYRNLAEDAQEPIFTKIKAHVEEVILPRLRESFEGAEARFEQLYSYPAHGISADHPYVATVKSVVGRNSHSKVAYGTEAGLFAERMGIATLVCGPGSILQAHKANEFIERSQLAACDDMILGLAKELLCD